MNFLVEVRSPGEPLMYPVPFFHRAWTEFIELQAMEQQKWVQQSVQYIESTERYELLALDGSTPAGGMILGSGWDVHVGECLAVMFNYVLPEYRNKRIGSVMFREVLALTKRLGLPHLSYTHRVRDWEYVTKYRRIHRGPEEA